MPSHSDPLPPRPPPSDAPPELRLAAEIAGITVDRVGPAALAVAAQCVLDGLGVAIAATDEPGVRIVREVALAETPSGSATLLGHGARTGARAAALVNGTAAHALDYDDVLAAMGGHPTVPVLPAALALAEELGVGGRELLVAVVAGIETEARVGAALGTAHYARGFHNTATAGTLGAAAAAASLLRLPTERVRTALSIAATSASGLKANFGTMTKPLHAGQAAAAGLLAARLAGAGFTASDTGLTERRGMLPVLSDAPEPDALAVPFGQPWHVASVLFKFHAACYLTHATIDAALALRVGGLDPRAIESVDLIVPPGHLGVCAIPQPRTGLEGKFSLRFTTALALYSGATDESRFTDAAARDPELVALRDTVRVHTSGDIGHYAGRVTVRTRDGRTLQAEGDVSTPRWQHSPDEQAPALQRKFDGLVSPVLGPDATARLRRLLADLPGLGSVAELTRATVPDGGRTFP
ncbi:MmgE/PrpD family protein [Pseudonocardia sp.]|uniref:MmgE/PrpD family protein n=1 Tax=Pseudonocardia sp. TaxID=60912 RepID=UPI00261923AF|nr:MmgE/PrpD family protein [Pseudonocardia sp.]MCW2720479.1 MmgE/PrpD family protein [Pseudonocardia sp.]